MDIRKADLNLLLVLDALLRLRNASRAAEALDMSQPAVSYALGKLRVLFKDPLFIRAARGMRPTPRAEELALPLQEVLDRIADATRLTTLHSAWDLPGGVRAERKRGRLILAQK